MNSILKKYLRSFHCKFYIFALWFYGHSFPNFCNIFIMNYILVLWAFSHGTDISCNLHALPDYYFVTSVPSAAGKTAILLAKTIMHAKTFAILQKKKNTWYFVTKSVLVIEKKFWNSRLKVKNLQKFWDHKNNSFKQWKVRTIFGNRMLF